MMKQRIKKQFWLSPQDARELKRKAKLCGITETAVIRILLHGYEPKEKPDARFYEAMRQLSAIGNNINQLAVKANTLGFIDTPPAFYARRSAHSRPPAKDGRAPA